MALAIMAIVLTLVTVAVGNIRRADLKATTGQIAAAMRYLYNLAVINNTPYRLVLDLERGAFWGEELQTDDPCARYLPEDTDQDDIRGRGGAEEEVEAAARGDEELEPGAEADAAKAASEFATRKDNLLSERVLPRGIAITGVITAHHRQAQTEGRAAIHFFPGGYSERAWIWLGERDDPERPAEPLVTLELDGLMGRVTRHGKALDETAFAKESKR